MEKIAAEKMLDKLEKIWENIASFTPKWFNLLGWLIVSGFLYYIYKITNLKLFFILVGISYFLILSSTSIYLKNTEKLANKKGTIPLLFSISIAVLIILSIHFLLSITIGVIAFSHTLK